MDEYDLISVLKTLIEIPAFIKEEKENGFDTEFGLIETDCLGACIKITLPNKAITSISIINNEAFIPHLFEKIHDAYIEYGISLLKDKLNKCY